MSGMLNRGMGSMGAMSGAGIDPEMIMQLMQSQRKDPFARSLPGQGLLGPGGMSMPPSPPGLIDTQMNNPQQGMGGPSIPGMNTISTDFANTQPGLPNLPDSFLGFGYGQFAPKEVSTGPGDQGGMQGGMRQEMLMKMLEQLMPQLQKGMQNGMNFGGPDQMGGFGGLGGM